MLGPLDPLPRRPRRILVAGVSGVGKTTLSARIAAELGLPHTEIDALFHGADWTPREEFDADVDALVAQDEWVTEWQYGSARPRLAAAADLLVWLDLPFWTVAFPRVLRRTLRRRLRREELWNGNVEGPLWRVAVDPEHIVRWAVSTRNVYGERVAGAEADGLTVVRLRRRPEVEQWLTTTLARVGDSGAGRS